MNKLEIINKSFILHYMLGILTLTPFFAFFKDFIEKFAKIMKNRILSIS